MAQLSGQLIDDHAALGKVLEQLQTALSIGDLKIAHTKLDLFWARLAVHIRAEHLHLFPTVLTSLTNREINDASAPSLGEAQKVVTQLREDHDFFMHELARAVEVMRKLLTVPEQSVLEKGLHDVKNTIAQIEHRLNRHNEVEENQIYLWAATVLGSEEQAKLAKQIMMELQKRPSRFTENNWSHK